MLRPPPRVPSPSSHSSTRERRSDSPGVDLAGLLRGERLKLGADRVAALLPDGDRLEDRIERLLFEAISFGVPFLVTAVHDHDPAIPEVVRRDRGVGTLGSGWSAAIEDQELRAIGREPLGVEQALRPPEVDEPERRVLGGNRDGPGQVSAPVVHFVTRVDQRERLVAGQHRVELPRRDEANARGFERRFPVGPDRATAVREDDQGYEERRRTPTPPRAGGDRVRGRGAAASVHRVHGLINPGTGTSGGV